MADPSRRDLLRSAALAATALALPAPLFTCARGEPQHEPRERTRDPDRERLASWTHALRAERHSASEGSLGVRAVRVGELAIGTPYEPYTLEAYLKAGGSPAQEPLLLSLTRFDCVTLVEACLAVARLAKSEGTTSWEGFGREIERMRYRGGERRG